MAIFKRENKAEAAGPAKVIEDGRIEDLEKELKHRNDCNQNLLIKLNDLQNILIPHFIKHPVFCAKLHAFNLLRKIVNLKLNNKNNLSLYNQQEMLKMSLSMNKTNNRTEERKNLLYSLLDITEDLDKKLIPNTITDINSKLCSNDHIAGILDGDGSFFYFFSKRW